jgi:hypothetical protein
MLHSSPSSRRARPNHLDPQEVLPLLTGDDAKLRHTANWIIGRHPEWAGALARFCQERLDTGSISASDLHALEPALARAASAEPVQEFLTNTFRRRSSEARAMALRVMARAKLQTTPKEWESCVLQTLLEGGETLPLSLAVARDLGSRKGSAPTLATGLLSIARDQTRAAELRLSALAALPAEALSSDRKCFRFSSSNSIRRSQPLSALPPSESLRVQMEDRTARTIGRQHGEARPP